MFTFVEKDFRKSNAKLNQAEQVNELNVSIDFVQL